MEEIRRWKNFLGYLLGFSVLGTIAYFGGIKSFQATTQPRMDLLLLCFFTNGLVLFVSSSRWGLLINRIEGKKVCPIFQYFVMFVSVRLLGQYTSHFGGDFLMRPGLLNRLNGISFKKGFSASVIEKSFDILVIPVLVLPAIFYLYKLIPGQVAFIFIVILWAFLVYFMTSKKVGLLGFLKRKIFESESGFKKIPILNRLVNDESLKKIIIIGETKFFDQKFIFNLLALTTAKYLLLILRLYLLIGALGLSFPFAVIFIGFLVSQVSLIFAFTPGGFGVLEAGWYAVFSLWGISNVESAAFLIGQRVYLLLFMGVTFLLCYFSLGIMQLIRLNQQ